MKKLTLNFNSRFTFKIYCWMYRNLIQNNISFGVHHHHNTPYSTQGFLYITLYEHYVELKSKYSLYINMYMHRHNKLSDRILRSLCMGNEKVFRFVRVVDIRIHFLHLWQIYYPYSISKGLCKYNLVFWKLWCVNIVATDFDIYLASEYLIIYANNAL